MKGEKVANGSKYEYGQKRCTMCGIFMLISGFRCPCCSALLRTKSRNKKIPSDSNYCRDLKKKRIYIPDCA